MSVSKEKLAAIKALVLDCDGVLTDSRIWLDSQGEWRRFFSIRDGYGIKQLISQGYTVGIITQSKSEDIRKRVQVLKIPFLYEGSGDKLVDWKSFLEATGYKGSEVAYMGDDLPDLPLLELSGFSATVPEAVPALHKVAHHVCERPGGLGAVREVCDLIEQWGWYSK